MGIEIFFHKLNNCKLMFKYSMHMYLDFIKWRSDNPPSPETNRMRAYLKHHKMILFPTDEGQTSPTKWLDI